MRKLFVSARKEILLLLRDRGGLAMLFLMPVVLIITMTLIQESTYKAAGASRLAVLLADEDGAETGLLIRRKLSESPLIKLITHTEDTILTHDAVRKLVTSGAYQIGLVIPEGLTRIMDEKIQQNVRRILQGFAGMIDSTAATTTDIAPERRTIRIYFDPATGEAFRSSVRNNIAHMLSRLETEKIYAVFREEMELKEDNVLLSGEDLISFQEIIPRKGKDTAIPNAVQHNVPAWILFGIFFIVVPLGINLVREKNQGTYIRLRTSPVSYITFLSGKVLVYAFICLLQFGLMLSIARFIFPLIGLYPFHAGSQLLLMMLIALCSGLAAIGLAILIGTIADTQEQSAPFGAILVIILAAIGGVWVPTFVMPHAMQQLSAWSPMNWGISAYYEVILRNGSLKDILQELFLLLLCFALTLVLAILYDRKKQMI